MVNRKAEYMIYFIIGLVVGCVCGFLVGRTFHGTVQKSNGNNTVQIGKVNKYEK